MPQCFDRLVVSCLLAGLLAPVAAQNPAETQRQYQEQERQRRERERDEQRARERQRDHDALMSDMERLRRQNAPPESAGRSGSSSPSYRAEEGRSISLPQAAVATVAGLLLLNWLLEGGKSTVGEPPVPTFDWRAGTPHPSLPNVVAGQDVDRWVPLSGFAWANPGKSGEVVWQPNTSHPRIPNVVATARPHIWEPEPGFRSVDALDLTRGVIWSPGAPHPRHRKVVAATVERKWAPAPGYDWVDAQKSWEVAWVPYRPVGPANPKVMTSDVEGTWMPALGYDWLDRQRWTVKWVSGTTVGQNPRFTATATEGEWSVSGGVGIAIQSTGFVGLGLEIVRVYPGSPAERAGLKAGMRLVTVDGLAVAPMQSVDIQKALGGPESSHVAVEVFDPATQARTRVTLVRGTYTVSDL